MQIPVAVRCEQDGFPTRDRLQGDVIIGMCDITLEQRCDGSGDGGFGRNSLDEIEAYRSGVISDPEHKVQVNVRDLLALVDCSGEIASQLQEAERKIQEKIALANKPESTDTKGTEHEA